MPTINSSGPSPPSASSMWSLRIASANVPFLSPYPFPRPCPAGRQRTTAFRKKPHSSLDTLVPNLFSAGEDFCLILGRLLERPRSGSNPEPFRLRLYVRLQTDLGESRNQICRP